MIPSLPLINNCLLLDNTSLEILQSCPRAFQYNRLNKKIAAYSKPGLDFGSAIHQALEWRYKNCRNNTPTLIDEEQQSEVLQKYFNDNPPRDEEDRRTLNHANEIIRRYNQKYRLEPFNILIDDKGTPLVELSFALPLCKVNKITAQAEEWNGRPESLRNEFEIGIIFTGKTDLPVSWDGQVIIIDHKTSSMFFGPQRFIEEQKVSNQYLGYCWAFQTATKIKVGGFCTNGIPTKLPPAKPKQGLDGWWNEWFIRDITYLALYPNCLEMWKQDAISLIENMFWHFKRQSFPQWGKFVRTCSAYGGCAYKDVCFDPNQNEGLLDSEVFVENTWSPLNKVEISNV